MEPEREFMGRKKAKLWTYLHSWAAGGRHEYL